MGLNPNAPNWSVPIAGPDGTTTQPWFGYLTQLSGAPGPIVPIAPGPSPFSYTAPVGGTVAISGGTVSLVTLSRARVSNVDLGLTSGSFPVGASDVVTVTYSAAPTINFIPL